MFMFIQVQNHDTKTFWFFNMFQVWTVNIRWDAQISQEYLYQKYVYNISLLEYGNV
jgi:hypothetical protein